MRSAREMTEAFIKGEEGEFPLDELLSEISANARWGNR